MHIYPAHFREDGEGIVMQSLREHCVNASNYAGEALKTAHLQAAGRVAGLLHDLGKAKKEFEEYLFGNGGARGSVNHTFAGAKYLLSHFHNDTPQSFADIAAELLAFAVGAHHGLFDCVKEDGGDELFRRWSAENIDYAESCQNFFAQCAAEEEIEAMFQNASSELAAAMERIDNYADSAAERDFYIGLLARLLLSAVIEGDRRDTAEFQKNIQYPAPPADMRALWRECTDATNRYSSRLPHEKAIDRVRQTISQRCAAFVGERHGLYRLYLPTGAGKTIAGLRAALNHAKTYGKERIFILSPLLTITEQNAAVIRGCIGNDALILEHHSNLVQTREKGGELDDRELFAENWHKPIVISTLVQFLNTLFAGKTTCIRRFQALCNSVIVIDEVQTVPPRMLSLFNYAMNFLTEFCEATVLLCSATQPCLENAQRPLKKQPSDVIPPDEELYAVFRRTELRDAGQRRLEEIPSYLMEHAEGSALVVCNKRAEAAQLYQSITGRRKFHLSASMCAKHRSDTLEALRQSLKTDAPLCISTQVIEAGVDISFDYAIRLAAGMDSILQTAGRCNRNGTMENAFVDILQCADENLNGLKEIKQAREATQELLWDFRKQPEKYDGALSSEKAITEYYRRLYRGMPTGAQDYDLKQYGTSIFRMLSDNGLFLGRYNKKEVRRFYLQQAFQTAGASFQVFDEITTDVLVPYGEGRTLILELQGERAARDAGYFTALVQRAKQYSVSLYAHQKAALEKAGGLHQHNGIWMLDAQYYDCEGVGLTMEAQPQEFLEAR